MDTTALADEPTVATDTPPSRSELVARRLADAARFLRRTWPHLRFGTPGDGGLAGKSESDEGTTEQSAEKGDEQGSEAVTERTTEQGDPSRSDPPALDRWWLLVAPLAGAVPLSAASVLVEPNPLRTGTSPSGLLAFAVLIPFFLLCVAGTLALVRDATLVRAAETDWSPNPWRYLVPSAVLLTAIRSYPVAQTAGRSEGLVGYLVGTFVVALAAASILAGPAYLYRRRDRVARN